MLRVVGKNTRKNETWLKCKAKRGAGFWDRSWSSSRVKGLLHQHANPHRYALLLDEIDFRLTFVCFGCRHFAGILETLRVHIHWGACKLLELIKGLGNFFFVSRFCVWCSPCRSLLNYGLVVNNNSCFISTSIISEDVFIYLILSCFELLQQSSSEAQAFHKTSSNRFRI